MWCPECKNEYVAGITHCADCGVPLVEALPAADFKEDYLNPEMNFMPENSDLSPDAEESNHAADIDAIKESSHTDHAHAYISMASKAEDMKSTAYAFTFVGGAGLIALVLLALGVIPLSLAASTKVMMYIVMGAMFFIFLCVGIRSFSKIKGLKDASVAEDTLLSKTTEWFLSSYGATDIDAGLDTTEPEETLYFARYDVMKELIISHNPDIEVSVLDHIIETLYSRIF